MRSSASKIQMAGFDSLFQSNNQPSAEQVQEIPLSELHPFKNHPFQIRDDEAMQKTAESIAQYGVLSPGIVRPRPEGGYELVSGHRRKRGSELAGKATMPVLVRELDDDEATIIMVDSNLQREKILPSEKAFAYKMKLEALKHQGKRYDQTSARGVQNLTTRELVAQDAGEKSGMAVARYIALTKLIPPFLTMVDEDKLSFSTAADYISGLTEQQQTDLITVMDRLDIIPGKNQLAKIKQYSREGSLTAAVIDAVLSEERPAPMQVTLKKDRLKQYFPSSYTPQQIEEVILSLLETWKAQQ
ncbi:MAG: ParB/RepB/Spo0J family partition protein [Provencibacterium sp.]|jgi:ParB family chromosome partitioning protein|nr:ParB/RepB/Spo0J family partition protein [Provencibacterium sp.]